MVKKFSFYAETDKELASKFYEAGFGFLSGNELLFHPLEAAYLVKLGKTKFEGKGMREFIALQKKRDKRFPFAFEVFCLLRGKGRVVRFFVDGIEYFRVYAPGVGRMEERPSCLVYLSLGKLPAKFERQIKVAHRLRLDLIIACGREKAPKFYKISSFNF